VLGTLILVMCVIKCSVKRVVLKHINAFIVVIIPIYVKCVIKHSVIIAI